MSRRISWWTVLDLIHHWNYQSFHQSAHGSVQGSGGGKRQNVPGGLCAGYTPVIVSVSAWTSARLWGSGCQISRLPDLQEYDLRLSCKISQMKPNDPLYHLLPVHQSEPQRGKAGSLCPVVLVGSRAPISAHSGASVGGYGARCSGLRGSRCSGGSGLARCTVAP